MVKRWRQANADRHNQYQRTYRSDPDVKRRLRDGYYRRTFGILADEFDELLAKQGGGCAICGVKPERAASLHLDHDHVTGKVRAILCLSCNQGIGKFRDDPELLERAARYLRGDAAGGLVAGADAG
jgi:Recombination endonuclease VII